MAEDTHKRPDFSADYSSNASHESASDPLAELARLIGQSDPFTDLSKRAPRKPLDAIRNHERPAPEWLARPAAPGHDEYDAAPAPHQAYAQPAHRAAQPAPQVPAGYAGESAAPAEAGDYAEQASDYDHYPPDDRYRVSLPSGQYDPDAYYAEDGHLPPQGGEGVIHRRRGGLITIAAVVGLAVIGTAGAFGYRAFVSRSTAPANPPVIKADPTPAKTVPAPATTASVDPAKPIQDRIAPPAPERVVPREEQPVSLPLAPAQAAPRVIAPQPSAQAVAPLVSPPALTSVNEPKKVKTVIIRQNNSGIDSAAMASAPAAAPPVQPRAPVARQPDSGPMAIAPQSNARTKVAARTPAAQAAGGAYVVQVSAQKTEDEARASYHALQQKYPSVLSGREANIRRADLGDKGVYYRAQIGPFATADQANSVCGDLKAAGGQCIVQKN